MTTKDALSILNPKNPRNKNKEIKYKMAVKTSKSY